jgi:hypothetical protein
MKNIFLVLIFSWFCISCSTTSKQLFDDVENEYLQFEQRSLFELNNASDDELPTLFEKNRGELSDIKLKLYNYDSILFDPGNLAYKKASEKAHEKIDEYENRWYQSIEIPYQRYLLIRAKNSGNYLVNGNSEWLKFQEKYIISNILSRLRNAGRYNYNNVFTMILNEFQIDVIPLNNKLNDEQTEWVNKLLSNFLILGTIMKIDDNRRLFENIIQWQSVLPQLVNLINE